MLQIYSSLINFNYGHLWEVDSLAEQNQLLALCLSYYLNKANFWFHSSGSPPVLACLSGVSPLQKGEKNFCVGVALSGGIVYIISLYSISYNRIALRMLSKFLDKKYSSIVSFGGAKLVVRSVGVSAIVDRN